MSALSPVATYLTILSVAYLENVLPPVPGDMIVVFGGYMAGLGVLNPWVVIGLATIGGTLGFMSMYAIGHRVGLGLLDPDRYKWLPKRRILKARTYLQRWGYSLIAANRFLSGLRSVISLTVGMAHMSITRTTVWSFVSALVWTTLLTWAGVFVGENWTVVGGYLRTYGVVVTVIIVLFVLLRLFLYWKKRELPIESK
ncbi:MAG: DedA family protein [Bacteroidetes Order II. Incertae sedis bacterium]|nr:DedA family protein [Bacteroidetes Order II. bacterium]MBT5250787.1 DedA family protein [Bacteroidetes Order II. bacterium]MBT6200523.1 DedA family protein [Bacteroidetes Order II. bacterium]MBT6423871.1 DedA family protein [Bacteroidetes Order II. bacterium]MBT6581768.1 DedA family protein [Bacteroidetes Order II. bacterium]